MKRRRERSAVPPGRTEGKEDREIHKGFIRAEVFHYDDLIRLKNEQAVKAAGLLRSEGKDYVVRDGDIMLFRFNV